jgi:hypothetical protein
MAILRPIPGEMPRLRLQYLVGEINESWFVTVLPLPPRNV